MSYEVSKLQDTKIHRPEQYLASLLGHHTSTPGPCSADVSSQDFPQYKQSSVQVLNAQVCLHFVMYRNNLKILIFAVDSTCVELTYNHLINIQNYLLGIIKYILIPYLNKS